MKEIITKAKILALRDVEIKCKEAQLQDLIIPDLVYEIIKDLEVEYLKVDDDHDCHADTPEGHCSHPSHEQI